jgi:beta-1,4-mannosyltransferase
MTQCSAMAFEARAMRLRCAFVPDWDDNPYQRMLAQHLTNAGIETVCRKSLKVVLSEHLSGERRIDVVHLHWLNSLAPSPLSLGRAIVLLSRIHKLRKAGVKVVWTVHNLLPHESRLQWLDKILASIVARLAQAIVVHSRGARKEVVAAFRLQNEKIHVIPHANYVDYYDNRVGKLEARKRLGLDKQDLVFLYLGAIRPYKGVTELIGSFQRTAKEDARLVIAGKPLNRRIEEEVNRCIEDPERIIFRPGYVADDELQIYLNAADVVVFPYKRLLTSGALVLGMSFGKVCLAPRLDTITDYVDEKGAFLYEPNDGAALAKAIAQAILERERIAEMGVHNLRRAQDWNPDKVARMTATIYYGLLRQSYQRMPTAVTLTGG